MMKIYNTLTRQKEEFLPINPSEIKMFVCGPTVYDYIHIGNARTFVIFDVIAKYLKYKYGDGNVRYIQNITDVDNKIIERAEKERVDPLEYAKKYSDIFKQDMEALGVTSPEYKNATDHIPEVIKQVQTLLDKGNAYVIENDGIYFDLSTFPDYGKLSGRTASMADDAVSRIDDSDKKRNRGDFALWKFSQRGDPAWSLETGKYMGIMDSAAPTFATSFAEASKVKKASAGRPGWHIEDTSITEKYFGPQYDIHGGGQDLIFPHHEAEIAQQESASGLKPFVKYWMHSGFLVNKDEKMSKSSGNFTTLRDALKYYPKETLRLHFLSAHYRKPLDSKDSGFTASVMASVNIREFRNRLALIKNEDREEDAKEITRIVDETKEKILNALGDDLNTPVALAAYFDFMKDINKLFDQKKLGKSVGKILSIVSMTDEILGVMPADTDYTDNIPKEIRTFIDERESARQNKNWKRADELRDKLKNMGYKIDDTPYGPTPSPSPESESE